jgi:soluble lytic murein transglycosylase-like protein
MGCGGGDVGIDRGYSPIAYRICTQRTRRASSFYSRTCPPRTEVGDINRTMFGKSWITACLAAAAIPALAGESAVFTSGMRLHVDRHEEAGGNVRLYRAGAVTEVPRSVIAAFEPDEVIASPDAAPAEAQAVPDPNPPPPSPKTIDPKAMVREAAGRAGLPPAIVESVAKTESAFDPAAVSPKGAIGVMQLMPSTAKALGADPNDPAQNIEAGAKLLRELLLKYNGDVVKALAAYNAGEAAVDHYQGVPPYPETQHYVNSVVRDYLNHGGAGPDSGSSGAGSTSSGKGAGQ